MVRYLLQIVIAAYGIAGGLSASYAGPELANLGCVRLITAVEGGSPFGVYKDDLTRTMLVWVKANLPRLSVSDDCENILHSTLIVKDMRNGNLNAYHAMLHLEASRKIRVLEAPAVVVRGVWTRIDLMQGNSETIRRQVDEGASDLLKMFAEDYYEAGNP
jgi:hypothetical protein